MCEEEELKSIRIRIISIVNKFGHKFLDIDSLSITQLLNLISSEVDYLKRSVGDQKPTIYD